MAKEIEISLPKIKNLWKIATIGLLVLSCILGFTLTTRIAPKVAPKAAPKGVGMKGAAEQAVKFINENILPAGRTAKLISVNEAHGLYNLTLEINGRKFESYLTKDGKLLFPRAINLEKPPKAEVPKEKPKEEIPKAARPKVELFVMSFCPYGNKAEQTMKPVFELLKEKVEWKPHYIVSLRKGKISSLHGSKEVLQDKREVCVLKKYGINAWFDFVSYINENCGSTGDCWKEASTNVEIDPEEIASCVKEKGDQFLKEEAKISQERRATGSPTLFINGVSSQVVYKYGNSEAYKQAICSGFKERPKKCEKKLESKSAEAGAGGRC